MKKTALILIKFYQKYLSLDQGYLGSILGNPKVCKFEPTCSHYTYQAIEKYGFLKGGFKGLYRIVRCNPFNKGGIDELK